MALILYSGFRVSEVCALTIGQVMHVPHGTVRLRRKGGAWKEAKVSEELYPWLEAYLATRKDKDAPNAPLFITTHGLCRRYDRNTLNFPCQLYRNTNRRFVLPPCYSFSAAYKLYH